MFFKLHESAKIGCKLLTSADLGIGSSSHQTHIGLFEDTLDFIEDYYQQSFAQFIYGDTVKELITFLDGIKNQDGTYRSPKIRSGNRNEMYGIDVNSVVKEIRDIVSFNDDRKWYLIRFGLDNNDIVFMLFDEGSVDYNILNYILGDNLNKLSIGREDSNFSRVLNYLNTKINHVNIQYLEELENIVQSGDNAFQSVSRVRIRNYDIEKAKKRFNEVGRKGEELVNGYLVKLKQNSKIIDFTWSNQDKESYLPYDFEITTIDGNIIYSDVKTTGYKFEQDMFFSGNELTFINNSDNFIIYRVYNIDESPLLKICNNINKVSNLFLNNFDPFNVNMLNEGLKVKNINMGVSPLLDYLSFSNDIKL